MALIFKKKLNNLSRTSLKNYSSNMHVTESFTRNLPSLFTEEEKGMRNLMRNNFETETVNILLWHCRIAYAAGFTRWINIKRDMLYIT